MKCPSPPGAVPAANAAAVGGHSPSAASGRGRCASGPGWARDGGRFCARGREPGRAQPCRVGRLRGSRGGKLRAGSILFGEPGGERGPARAAPRRGRFVSRIPAAAAGVGRGRRGMRSAGPSGHLGAEAAGPREERAAWRSPARSAPTTCSHLAAGAPRTCPEGGNGVLEVSVTRAWCVCVGGAAGGGGRVCENKELPNTHRSSSCLKCYNRTT